MSDAEAKDKYIRGLKYNIQKDVWMAAPKNLAEAFQVAERTTSVDARIHGPSSSQSRGRDNRGYAPMDIGNMRVDRQRRDGDGKGK